jgi:hypothetical protein
VRHLQSFSNALFLCSCNRVRLAGAVAKRWGRPLPFLADMQLSAHAEESADSAPQAAADTVSDDVNQKFRDAFKLCAHIS